MDDPAKLRARLDRGEWLTPGEVAVVTGMSRSTVHGWLAADPPRIRWRPRPLSRHRECDPRDVLALLAPRNDG